MTRTLSSQFGQWEHKWRLMCLKFMQTASWYDSNNDDDDDDNEDDDDNNDGIDDKNNDDDNNNNK